MASKFLNNLSNTYSRSPSLQNQFATEQDYLDLFNDGRTTPAMAKAFNIDDYGFEDEGIKSIINTTTPIINQGGGTDNTPPTGPKTGFSIQGAPYGNAKGGMHNYDDDDNLGWKDAFGLAMGGPFGYATGKIGQWAFNKVKDKYSAWATKEKERKEIEKAKADAAAAVAAGRAYDYEGRSNQYGTHTSTMTNKQAQANQEGRRGGTGTRSGKPGGSAGFGKSFHGAQGGRVGAKDGGSMIQIVKDRLMEKNPAMWGLGYEGLASLQDLIMSMPFNQGGIVNIRRR